MHLNRRQRWFLLAGAATAVAAPLAERAIAMAWRSIEGEDPPTEIDGPNVTWGRAVVWTAASAVIVALAQVAARRGAALVWERMTGERPPRPRGRRRSRKRR